MSPLGTPYYRLWCARPMPYIAFRLVTAPYRFLSELCHIFLLVESYCLDILLCFLQSNLSLVQVSLICPVVLSSLGHIGSYLTWLCKHTSSWIVFKLFEVHHRLWANVWGSKKRPWGTSGHCEELEQGSFLIAMYLWLPQGKSLTLALCKEIFKRSIYNTLSTCSMRP